MQLPTWVDVARVLSLLQTTQKTLSGKGLGASTAKGSLQPLSRPELPGGTPFSLCDASRPTDLFSITSIELSKQPVYIDDEFLINIYGTFQDTFVPNATIDLHVDCGSHCEEYGAPRDEWSGETDTEDFCMMSEIQQPLGGRKSTCPPAEKGFALITSMAWVVPLFFHAPSWYNFTFDAKTAQGDRIYCLTAEVCLRWEDEEKNKHFPPGRWNDCRWPR